MRSVGVAIVLLAVGAHAQDAGFEWVPGVYVAPSGFRIFGGRPHFVDAQQRVAVIGADRLEVLCHDAAYNVSTRVPAGFNETFSHFAVDAAVSEVWLVSYVANSIEWHARFTRFSCTNGREAQVIDLPAQPVATINDGVPFTSWVAAPGVIEFTARDGVYRVDTASMVPSAQRVVSEQTVLAALGEAAPLGNALQTVRACSAASLGARLCTVGTLVGQSVVLVDATGLLVTRLEGPLTGTSAPMGLWLVDQPAFSGTLVMPWGRYGPWRRDRALLGFVGEGSFHGLRVARDTTANVGGGLNRILPGAGTAFAVVDGVLPNSVAYVDVLPLTFEPEATDFDLDGLARQEELALGTDPGDEDSDGDGVIDGVELGWFETDPRDAGAHPPRREPAWRWGYNSMPGLTLAIAEQTLVPACPGHDPGPCVTCREADGRTRPATGFCQATGGRQGPLGFTATTRDGKATFVGVKETSTSPQLIALQRLSSDPVLFPSSVPVSAGDPIYAADEDTVYQLGRLASGTRLVRFTPQGSVELSLQTGCPVQGSAPGCVERLRFGPLTNVDLLETLGAKGAVIARVEGRFGDALVALDEAGYHLLADITDLGLVPRDLGFQADKSDFLFAGPANLDQRHRETWRMGIDFAPRTLRRNELETSVGPLRPYRVDQVPGGGRGYPSQRQEEWFVDPVPGGGSAGCLSVGGVTLCDEPSFPSTPVPVPYVSMPPEELLPTEPALRPGDVLVARVLGTWTTTSPWGLSKLDRRGTLVNWLLEQDFLALIDDAAERDALLQSPLQEVVSLSVAPSGLQACLVEKTVGRVWEVRLDATTRVAASVRRVPASIWARACAYDADGKLVVATDSELIRDGVRFAEGLSGTQGFSWLGDRWAVWGLGRPVQCFDAAGQSDGGLGWDALAVSPFAGGVAWVDQQGRAFAGTLDELCDRLQVPREGFITEERLTFYQVLSNDVFRPISRRRIQFTARSVGAGQVITTAGALVMRPDGVGLFGAWNRWVEGLGFDTPLKGPDATFFFEPALQPKDLTKRWPQFDPYRNPQLTWTMLAVLAGPMALVPGADATGDWGRYVPLTPWVPDGGWPAPIIEPTGGGSGAGGGGGGTMNPPGCTCGSVDVGLLALALALLGRRRASG